MWIKIPPKFEGSKVEFEDTLISLLSSSSSSSSVSAWNDWFWNKYQSTVLNNSSLRKGGKTRSSEQKKRQ